jgi:RNA polymerase sigma-70 factor (ECF subfamily)
MDETSWDARSCVEQVRRGDEDAARDLLRRLLPGVLKIVRAHLPRRTSEEDLVQNVFVKVFTKLDQFSGTVPLEHWVSRIAVNTCINELHRERVRPELRWADLSEEQEEVVRTLATSETDLPVSQSLAARDLVDRLLEKLAPQDRLVVTLLHLEGRTLEDIQRITGWNRTLIKVRAFRARARLKKHLESLLREERT